MHDEFFTLLKTEHDKVKSIIDEILSTPLVQKEQRETMFHQLKMALIPHMKGEEIYLYQTLERNKETHMLAIFSEEEHRAVRQVLHLMDELAPDEERWNARLLVLYHMLLNHIQNEETTVFDKARRVLSDDQIHYILDHYKETEQKVMAKV